MCWFNVMLLQSWQRSDVSRWKAQLRDDAGFLAVVDRKEG
jgi:hypothetical protein